MRNIKNYKLKVKENRIVANQTGLDSTFFIYPKPYIYVGCLPIKSLKGKNSN